MDAEEQSRWQMLITHMIDRTDGHKEDTRMLLLQCSNLEEARDYHNDLHATDSHDPSEHRYYGTCEVCQHVASVETKEVSA